MNMKKLIFITLFFFAWSYNSYANDNYFIDFTKVLNVSKPGAEAQKILKGKFQSESKKFSKLEKDIKKEESEIISQKNVLTAEDYKKKFKLLEKKLLICKKANKTLSTILLNLEMMQNRLC